MSVGRPMKFQSVEELQKRIDNYFQSCDEQKKPYTITGLALALDTYRDVLIDYEAKDEYSNTIKKAKQKCENFAEEKLFSGGQVAGIIFNLKNNYKRWKDKTETDLTTKGDKIQPFCLPSEIINKNDINRSTETDRG